MRIALVSASAALAAATFMIPAAAQSSNGDATRGRTVFARCASCHAVTPGTNRIGPSLSGIVGRKAGTVPKFNYSPAMRNSNLVWNARNLDSFLTRPATHMPGNRMVFPGLANSTDRANLIAYLNTVR